MTRAEPRFPTTSLDLLHEDQERERRDHQAILDWRTGWLDALEVNAPLSSTLRKLLVQVTEIPIPDHPQVWPKGLSPFPSQPDPRALLRTLLWRAGLVRFLTGDEARLRVRESLMPAGMNREADCALCLLPLGASPHESRCPVEFLWANKIGFFTRDFPKEMTLAWKRGWMTYAWSFQSPQPLRETAGELRSAIYRIRPLHAGNLIELYAASKQQDPWLEIAIAKYQVLQGVLPALGATLVTAAPIEEVPLHGSR